MWFLQQTVLPTRSASVGSLSQIIWVTLQRKRNLYRYGSIYITACKGQIAATVDDGRTGQPDAQCIMARRLPAISRFQCSGGGWPAAEEHPLADGTVYSQAWL